MGATEEVASSTISHVNITKNATHLNTPPVNTPPGAITPPEATDKRRIGRSAHLDSGARSERSKTMDAAVDPDALRKALSKEFEETGRTRDITPGGSPSRKRQRIYGDR